MIVHDGRMMYNDRPVIVNEGAMMDILMANTVVAESDAIRRTLALSYPSHEMLWQHPLHQHLPIEQLTPRVK